MRFDLLTILKHFSVDNGRLYRRHASGHSRAVVLLERGRLVSMLNGVRVFGPDVAWACHYRVVPMFPVFALDGDPFNLTETNLMPVRLKRLRWRLIEVPGGFRHPQSHQVFRSYELARADWLTIARRYYLADKPYVRQLEDSNQIVKPDVPERAVARKVYAARPSSRPGAPEAVAGRVWRWWNDAWLSLPEACHASDDWMVRAGVVLKSPGARFVYDDVAEKTVAVL